MNKIIFFLLMEISFYLVQPLKGMKKPEKSNIESAHLSLEQITEITDYLTNFRKKTKELQDELDSIFPTPENNKKSTSDSSTSHIDTIDIEKEIHEIRNRNFGANNVDNTSEDDSDDTDSDSDEEIMQKMMNVENQKKRPLLKRIIPKKEKEPNSFIELDEEDIF